MDSSIEQSKTSWLSRDFFDHIDESAAKPALKPHEPESPPMAPDARFPQLDFLTPAQARHRIVTPDISELRHQSTTCKRTLSLT
jgi:hypothetical protein